MKPALVTLTAVLLVLSAHGTTNDVERAVLRFPEISAWKFRPDIAVGCANTLIQAGRDPACEQLKQLAQKQWEDLGQQEKANQNICLLCRLVFADKSSSEFLRAPRLGALENVPSESMDAQGWPYQPFAITNDVPLSITGGYMGTGVPERAGNYLTYCLSNGVFRTAAFPVPTALSGSNALHQVLSSPAWKALKWKDSGLGWSIELDEDNTKEMLWKQVENMANKTPTTQSANPNALHP